MKIELYANGKRLDVIEDQVFTYTRQVRSNKAVESDFSNIFLLPTTENNKNILGLAEPIASQRKEPYERIPCKLVVNGIEIISSGAGVYDESNDKNIRLTINGGNFDFFQSLQNVNITLLSTLRQFDFDWTVANWASRVNNDSGVVTSLFNFGEGEFYGVIAEDVYVPAATASVYLNDIFGAILQKYGFTSEVPDDVNSDIVVPFPNGPKISFYDQAEKNMTYLKNTRQEIIGETTVTFPNLETGDLANNYSGSNYLPNKPFVGRVRIAMTGQISGWVDETDSIIFYLETPGVGTPDQDFFLGSVNQLDWSFQVEVTVPFYPPKSYQITAFEDVRPAASAFVDTGTFTIEALEFAAPPFNGLLGSKIDVARSLPEITEIQLVADYIALSNTIYQSTQEKSIQALPFDDLLEQDPQVWDDFLDESKEIKFNYRAKGFGQINRFAYQQVEGLPVDQDFFLIRDLNLPSDADLFTSIFGNSRDVYTPNLLSITAEIDLNDFEELEGRGLGSNSPNSNLITINEISNARVNDIMLYEDSQYIVEGVTIVPASGATTTILQVDRQVSKNNSDLPYVLLRIERKENKVPRLHYVRQITGGNVDLTDGQDVSNVTDFKVNNFEFTPGSEPSLSMDDIIDINYRNTQKWLNQYKEIEAFFVFDLTTLINIDFLKPIYLTKYDSYFFLKKIDRWRGDASFKCILQRISVGMFNQVIEEFTNLTFSTFQADRQDIIVNTDAAGSAISNVFGVLEKEEYEINYLIDQETGNPPIVRIRDKDSPGTLIAVNEYKLNGGQGLSLFEEKNMLIAFDSNNAVLEILTDGPATFTLTFFLIKITSSSTVDKFLPVSLDSVIAGTPAWSCVNCSTNTQITLNISGGVPPYQYDVNASGVWGTYTGPFITQQTGSIDYRVRDSFGTISNTITTYLHEFTIGTNNGSLIGYRPPSHPVSQFGNLVPDNLTGQPVFALQGNVTNSLIVIDLGVTGGVQTSDTILLVDNVAGESQVLVWAGTRYEGTNSTIVSSWGANVGNTQEISIIPQVAAPVPTVAQGTVQFAPVGCNRQWTQTYTPSGGCGGPYQISIDGGVWRAINNPEVFNSPATYSVKVRDKCRTESVAINTIVPDDQLPAPTAINISSVFNPDNNCVRDWDILFNIVGGTAPYTVSLNAGPFLVVTPQPNGSYKVNTTQEGNNTITIRDLCNTESIVYNVDVGTQALPTPSIISTVVTRIEPPSGQLAVEVQYTAGVIPHAYRYKFDTELDFTAWQNIVPDDGILNFETNENAVVGNPTSIQVEIRDQCLAVAADSGAIPPPPLQPGQFEIVPSFLSMNSCDVFDYDLGSAITAYALDGSTTLSNGLLLSADPDTQVPISAIWWGSTEQTLMIVQNFRIDGTSRVRDLQTC